MSLFHIDLNKLETAEDLQLSAGLTSLSEVKLLVLPGFLGPQLLSILSREITSKKFLLTDHSIYRMERMPVGNLHLKLSRIFQEEAFLDVLSRLSGRPGLTSVEIAIQRMSAGDHMIDWHSDHDGSRKIGLVINLSTGAFEGGVFEVRTKNSEKILASHSSLKMGDAHLFLISHELEHRVTPVIGPTPRIMMSLWFS